jgi:hypothetical protein
MTDIEIRNQQQAVVPDQAVTVGTDLELWARQATAAAIYAERVCSTTMAPAAYRGKPAEAAAAILAGAELGFSPMASLRAFVNISGTPAPTAMTLRAVVQGVGHEVVIVESSSQRAVVKGRRRGDTEWQTSVWDVPRAQTLAQFKSNPNYRTNLAQMLVARATAEVCRWIASDAIMGMPYAAEEIGDQPDAGARPIARKVTVAELEAMSLDEVNTAVQAGEIRLELMTDQQRKTMFGLWADLGYDNTSEADRATRLELIARLLDLKSLETTSDLNRDQAEQVIAAFRARRDAEQGGAE